MLVCARVPFADLAIYWRLDILLEDLYGVSKEKQHQFIKELVEARWKPLEHLFVDAPSFNNASYCVTEGLASGMISRTRSEALKGGENFKLLPLGTCG